jgi:hypothetical protein
MVQFRVITKGGKLEWNVGKEWLAIVGMEDILLKLEIMLRMRLFGIFY